MFSWISNLRNCVLQIGSVSTVYLRGAQNTIAKNVWGIWGKRGATERLLCENLSLCKCLLHCVSLLFCTCEYAALESLDTGCVYTAFLRRFWLHLVAAFWVSIWIPKWVYPKANKGWGAAQGFLLCLGCSWTGTKVFSTIELNGIGSGIKLDITFFFVHWMVFAWTRTKKWHFLAILSSQLSIQRIKHPEEWLYLSPSIWLKMSFFFCL